LRQKVRIPPESPENVNVNIKLTVNGYNINYVSVYIKNAFAMSDQETSFNTFIDAIQETNVQLKLPRSSYLTEVSYVCSSLGAIKGED
jgi:hypothetical protein